MVVYKQCITSTQKVFKNLWRHPRFWVSIGLRQLLYTFQTRDFTDFSIMIGNNFCPQYHCQPLCHIFSHIASLSFQFSVWQVVEKEVYFICTINVSILVPLQQPLKLSEQKIHHVGIISSTSSNQFLKYLGIVWTKWLTLKFSNSFWAAIFRMFLSRECLMLRFLWSHAKRIVSSSLW